MNAFNVKGMTHRDNLISNTKVDTISLSTTDVGKYSEAYKYIITDSFLQKRIFITNKLSGTFYSFFVDEIKENNMQTFSSLDDSNDTICTYLTELSKTTKKENAEYILSFSILGNHVDLFAEIKERKWENTPFGDSTVYFFHFNSNGVLDSVFKKDFSGL